MMALFSSNMKEKCYDEVAHTSQQIEKLYQFFLSPRIASFCVWITLGDEESFSLTHLKMKLLHLFVRKPHFWSSAHTHWDKV